MMKRRLGSISDLSTIKHGRKLKIANIILAILLTLALVLSLILPITLSKIGG